MKRVLLTALSTLLAASAPVDAEAARPADITDNAPAEAFSYQLSRGQSQALNVNLVVQTEELVARRAVPIIFDARFGYTWEVQSLGDDGTATVANSLTGVQATASAGDQAEDISEITSAMRAARLSHQVTRDGTLLNQTGALESDDQLSRFVQDLVSSVWVQFPTDPVSVGDIWLQTIPLAIGLDSDTVQATTTAQYTLAGYANVGGARQAVIDVVYTSRLDGVLEDESGAGQRLDLLGRGNGHAYVLFNTETNKVTELSGTMGHVMTGTLISGNRVQTAYTVGFHVSALNSEAAPSPYSEL